MTVINDEQDEHDGNSGHSPKLTRQPVDFADTTFHSLAEKIERDYNFILKNLVMPELKNPENLKLREVRILSSLLFYDKPLSFANVSELFRYDPATVTRAVAILVETKHVKRVKSELDFRSVNLSLTEKGTVLANEYSEVVKSVFQDLECDMPVNLDSEDKMSLLNAMLKVGKRSENMRNTGMRAVRIRQRRSRK